MDSLAQGILGSCTPYSVQYIAELGRKAESPVACQTREKSEWGHHTTLRRDS